MLQDPVIGIYRNSTSDYEEYVTKIYSSSAWKLARPYVYSNGAWRPVGQAGTLMIPFATSSGDLLYTSDGELFQVRKH